MRVIDPDFGDSDQDEWLNDNVPKGTLVCSADWKELCNDVLQDIDDQLAQFGLEVVQLDTHGDNYLWWIEKRQSAP